MFLLPNNFFTEKNVDGNHEWVLTRVRNYNWAVINGTVDIENWLKSRGVLHEQVLLDALPDIFIFNYCCH